MLPVLLLGLVCACAGATIAAAVLSHMSDGRQTQLARQASTAVARTRVLEDLLRRQAAQAVSLAAEPIDALPANANVISASRITARTSDRRAPDAAPGRTAVSRPAPAPGDQVTSSGNLPCAPSAGDARVTEAMVAAAKRSNRLEGVDATKLGILRIDAHGVELRNGTRVPVGAFFPSCDRLLSTDPADAQIVTDKRTIMVF
jgi:predicted outer membrane lipoprotein